MSSQQLIDRVNEALDSIRPFLHADGGDMKLIDITSDMIARVELIGSCSTCNMSHMTMKNGVEEAVRRMAPEIKQVEAVRSETVGN